MHRDIHIVPSKYVEAPCYGILFFSSDIYIFSLETSWHVSSDIIEALFYIFPKIKTVALQIIDTIEIEQHHITYAKYFYDIGTKDNWIGIHRNGQYRFTQNSLHVKNIQYDTLYIDTGVCKLDAHEKKKHKKIAKIRSSAC
jgi:hypothetical protein